VGRKLILPVLMITLLLTACGGAAAEREIEARRDAYAAADMLCFTARVRADVGDTVFRCTLSCEAGREETEVRVVEPELIAGVTARLRSGETELAYDGVRLSVGDLTAAGLPPLAAAPLLAQALRGGHVVRAWREKDGDRALYAAELFFSDEWELTVWFDAETLTPLRGEFSKNGVLTASCEIEDFTY